MSHFTVLVPAFDEAGLEEKLAPYDENGMCFREGSRWDWWVVGGRWTGLLHLKDGRTGENGMPGLMTPPNEYPNRADAALAGDVDWESMRLEQKERAGRCWDTWERLITRYVTVREWLAAGDEGRGAIWEVVRQGIFGTEENPRKPTDDECGAYYTAFWFEPCAETREEHVEAAGRQGITHAFIDADGGWHEEGRMGWFGATVDDNGDYGAEFWRFVESLDEGQRVYVVDCHV